MKKLPRIVSAEPVIHGVLKIVFNDGYEGVVDLRPIIAKGRIFAWLQKAEEFPKSTARRVRAPRLLDKQQGRGN